MKLLRIRVVDQGDLGCGVLAMSYAVAGEIEFSEVIELDADEIEEILEAHQGAESTFDDVDETKVRVRWTGGVRVLRKFGTQMLRGRELSRTTIIVQGARLAVGSALTVELELGGERFQALVNVETSVRIQGTAVSLLRIGATSPRGNDLIGTQVRRGALARRARAH